jgi:hypothetical protein
MNRKCDGGSAGRPNHIQDHRLAIPELNCGDA